jgi:hypothetical protein
MEILALIVGESYSSLGPDEVPGGSLSPCGTGRETVVMLRA